MPTGASRSSFNTYLDAISVALSRAIDVWRSQATLVDVVITGPIATGGKFSGPPLGGLIRGFAPAGAWEPYTRAVADGIQTQMRSFEGTVVVPGLPWYPSYAALPMPVAPPMPNVPCPLVMLAPAAPQLLGENAISAAIMQHYGKPRPPCADEVAKAIGRGFSLALGPWLSSTVVVGCMGSGRVPTFAPPYVPVGAVVGGRGTMAAGGLV